MPYRHGDLSYFACMHRYPLLQPVIVMGLEVFRIAFGVSPWSREQSSQQTYNQVLWYTKNAHSGGVSP